MKKELVTIANALRGLGLSRSESFHRAWAVIRLEQMMVQKPVQFAYIKEKGEFREATAFGYASDFVPTKPDRAKVKPYVRRYWDVSAGGLRSYRADRLILA